MISIVVAIAYNGVIGREGKLPWHLPADLRRFRALTTGGALVMGRKTYESIGRPLPGRATVVLTRGDAGGYPAGVHVARSLAEALAAAGALAPEVYVVGGQEVYREALPVARRLHLTRIFANFDGDARFPPYAQTYRVDSAEYHRDERGGFDYSFETWSVDELSKVPQ